MAGAAVEEKKMGERWSRMREPVALEDYAEAAGRRLRELAGQPMDPSGQDAGNARATQPMPDRFDRGIGNTMPGFDPLKGLLATKPDSQTLVTQLHLNKPRRTSLGDLRAMSDVKATPDQVAAAIEPVQAVPENTSNWEWSTSRVDGKWTDWATEKQSYSSLISPVAHIAIHLHAPTRLRQETEKNFYPGPFDHKMARDYQKPTFILTPDRNTLLEVGVRDHAYFAEPVWQRPGTKNTRDYSRWRATGTE